MVLERRTSVLVLLPALALLLAAGGIEGQEAPSEETPAQECRVEFEDPVVLEAEGPVPVRTEITEAIGEPTEATIAEESGVQVVAAAANPEDARVLLLTLNTADAVPGDWAITIEGEEGSCAGQLSIAEDPAAEDPALP